MKIRILVAVLWMISLVGSVAITAHAQRTVRGKEPEIVSGPDLGFRIDRYNGSTPVGELVVKHEDQWVAVQFGASAKPAR